MKPGDYADYTWPVRHGGKPVRVIILAVHMDRCLVRLCHDLHNQGARVVRAGRLHICKSVDLRMLKGSTRTEHSEDERGKDADI